MEQLPAALLRRVLAAVPLKRTEAGPGLLALRLVCKRWSREVLHADVWGQRQVDVVNARTVSIPGLRRLPALGKLYLELPTKAADHSHNVLKSVLESNCKIRSLRVRFALTKPTVKVLKSILRKQGDSLEELNLEICAPKPSDLAVVPGILADAAGLASLASLRLAFTGSALPAQTYSQLPCALTRLAFGRGVTSDLKLRLMQDNKDSLQALTFDFFSVDGAFCKTAAAELRAFSAMRELSVPGHYVESFLPTVKLMDSMRTLEIDGSVGVSVKKVGDLFDRPPSERPQCLRILSFASLERFSTCMLRRLTWLEMTVRLRENVAKALLWHLDEMHSLAELRLKQTDAMAILWEQLQGVWTQDTAPRLRALHLHNQLDKQTSPAARQRDAARLDELVRFLAEERPLLSVCVDADCAEY